MTISYNIKKQSLLGFKTSVWKQISMVVQFGQELLPFFIFRKVQEIAMFNFVLAPVKDIGTILFYIKNIKTRIAQELYISEIVYLYHMIWESNFRYKMAVIRKPLKMNGLIQWSEVFWPE